jgi:mTERF domain-containing protein, mitochondrial
VCKPLAGRNCALRRVVHRRALHERHDGPQQEGTGLQRNPLELLRECGDTAQRAALLQQLGRDGNWSSAYDTYSPSPAEQYLGEALGQSTYDCMMLAVQRVQIAAYDVDTQLRPSIATLKAANVDLPDIWHLISKQPFILSRPDVLQRWLDFLAVYGLKSKDLFNFCLRTSQAQFLDSTVHQAGMAITYLRKLGIKDEFLATRLIGLWPEVLAKDVETQLVPLVRFLMSLGLEVPDVTNVIMEWPEILSCDVASHLEPLAAYLHSLGCGPLQVAQVIQACPHLARFEPRAAFESKLQPLRAAGLTDEDIRR